MPAPDLPADAAAPRLAAPAWVWLVGLAFGLLCVGAHEYRYAHPPPGAIAVGIPSGDMLHYSSGAQSYLQHGGLLTFPSPYDTKLERRDRSPLWVLILAAAKALTGSFRWAWVLLPLVFAPLVTVALYLVARGAGLDRTATRWFLLSTLLMGGAAVLLAGLGCAVDAASQATLGYNLAAPVFADGVYGLQGNEGLQSIEPSLTFYTQLLEFPHGNWHMTPFRVFLLPPDLITHVAFFLTALALLRGRPGTALLLANLCFWLHPAAGAPAFAMYGLACLLELGFGSRRRALLPLAGAALTGAGWVLYTIGGVGEIGAAKFQGSAQLLFHHIRWQGLLASFAPWCGALVWAGTKTGLRGFVSSRRCRVLSGWVLGIALLTWGLGALPGGERLQPLHYAKGFLLSGVILLCFVLLRAAGTALPRGRRWVVLALGLVAISGLDNVLFLRHYAGRDSVIVTEAQEELLERLRQLPEEEVIFDVSDFQPYTLGSCILALTRHRAVNGKYPGQPGFEIQHARVERFRQLPDHALLDQYDVSLLVIPDALWQRWGEPELLDRVAGYVLLRPSALE